MKVEKIDRLLSDDLIQTKTVWSFDPSEREALSNILRDMASPHDKETIRLQTDFFLSEAEHVACWFKAAEMRDAGDHRRDSLAAVETFRKAKKALGKIINGRLLPEIGCDKVFLASGHEPRHFAPETFLKLPMLRSAIKIYDEFEKLIPIIDAMNQVEIPRERPRTSAAFNFAIMFWRSFFIMPTTTRGGLFMTLLNRFFEICDAPMDEDENRIASKAINSLRKKIKELHAEINIPS